VLINNIYHITHEFGFKIDDVLNMSLNRIFSYSEMLSKVFEMKKEAAENHKYTGRKVVKGTGFKSLVNAFAGMAPATGDKNGGRNPKNGK
jgi:hypothetical protein